MGVRGKNKYNQLVNKDKKGGDCYLMAEYNDNGDGQHPAEALRMSVSIDKKYYMPTQRKCTVISSLKRMQIVHLLSTRAGSEGSWYEKIVLKSGVIGTGLQ